LKVFTAGDAPGDWLSFRLHEASMPEAGDGGRCEWRVARLLLQDLPEVRDECSFDDLADGVGYSRWSCKVCGKTAGGC
jgi:hypothetical protein